MPSCARSACGSVRRPRRAQLALGPKTPEPGPLRQRIKVWREGSNVGALLVLAFLMAVVVLVPLVAVKLVFNLALGILFLPFRILGFLMRLVFGVFGLAARVVFSGVGLLFGLLGLILALLVAPLLPLLLLVGFVWFLARLFRAPVPARHSL